MATAGVSDNPRYVIWSRCWRAWWRPKRAGYTDDVAAAGRYSRAEAEEIERSRCWRAGFKRGRGFADRKVLAPEFRRNRR